MTGPLASTTGELHPFRCAWAGPELRDHPLLRDALITLEAGEQGGYSAKVTPEMARAVREYILELRDGQRPG